MTMCALLRATTNPLQTPYKRLSEPPTNPLRTPYKPPSHTPPHTPPVSTPSDRGLTGGERSPYA